MTRDGSEGTVSAARLLAIVTDPLEGPEPAEEIRRRAGGAGVELRLVVPAIEGGPFRHLMGDVDEAARWAEETLRASLRELRRFGIGASGVVGDPDPVQAAEDALRRAPADEVLIFERDGKERWFEHELFERAREHLEPPLRLVELRVDGGDEHVVGVEEAGPGLVAEDADGVEISDNLPRFHRVDLVGIVIAIVGTIAAAVLAAATTAAGDTQNVATAISILVAIGIALINMAHVVGLTLLESVRYRSGAGRFFGTLSLVGTPLAVLVNLALLLSA